MIKRIIGSKIDLSDVNNPMVQEFNSYIEDILQNEDILKLDDFYQHISTSRLQHSMNVAYYTFQIAKKFNLHVEEATRAALLHDFFLYDWRTTTLGYHPSEHPRQALINARKHFEVTPIMEDAIVKHMWPLSFNWPVYKESWAVTFADKYAASLEIAANLKDSRFAKLIPGFASSK